MVLCFQGLEAVTMLFEAMVKLGRLARVLGNSYARQRVWITNDYEASSGRKLAANAVIFTALKMGICCVVNFPDESVKHPNYPGLAVVVNFPDESVKHHN